MKNNLSSRVGNVLEFLIANSHETAVFDNLRWLIFKQYYYQNPRQFYYYVIAKKLMGVDPSLFKVSLQNFTIRIRIIVDHYPLYSSQYNPIELELFLPVPRTIKPTILTSLEQVQKLMTKTSHSKGLRVKIRIAEKIYS